MIHQQDDETGAWHKATWRSLFRVLVLASLVRCVFLLATYRHLDGDPDAYRKLAGNVWETGVYGWKTEAPAAGGGAGSAVRPTAFRPPLYPALLVCLGGFRGNWPIALLHLVLGVATAGLVACLAWRAGLGRWGTVAALLVALDPILLQQSTLVMTETLAAFLATLALFCLSAPAMTALPSSSFFAIRSNVVAGAVLGLCVLCRPTFLPWLGLIALARVGSWRGIFGRGSAADVSEPGGAAVAAALPIRLAGVAVLVGSALLVMSPWVIRNQLVLGRAKLTTTHGGYTVLLGNNPLFYRFVQAGAGGTWDGQTLARAWQRRSLTSGPADDQWNDLDRLAGRAVEQGVDDGSEFADDDLAYSLAQRYIRDQPGMFAYASGLRITRLWRLAPHRVGESESRLRMALRYLVGVWYALIMGLAVLGLAKLGRRVCAAPWSYGVQLCFVFTAVHAVYWSDMRMRAPLMPLVCLAAASGMAVIGERLWRLKA